MDILAFIVWCFLSYGIGCVSWSAFFVRRLRGIDLREHGSGNLGATNAGRILGRNWAVCIYLLDFGKGAVAAGVPACLGADLSVPVPLAVAGGLLAILGHVFPAQLNFRGGKGVATASGVILVLEPLSALIAVGAFIATAVATRMVSAASIMAAISLPIGLYIVRGPQAPWVMGLFLVLALLVTYLHRTNIQRILNGTESRIGKKST